MTTETLEFKTEVNQLLDLVIHSLYSHKEVFLRELISNASDAIDKRRYESLINPDLGRDAGDWKIRITADKDKGTLTISDNGIGMTRQEAIRELGTIARSGTVEFLKSLKDRDVKDNPELIGQFGVGFYSSFMVADSVTVISKSAQAGDNPAIKWQSEAKGAFVIEDTEKATAGTDIILQINKEEDKYLDLWELRSLVKKYSDYIAHPIVMEVEREQDSSIDKSQKVKVKEDEVLNSMKAIWLKDKADITEAEYNEFYKHISHDFTDPLKVIHYKAEGTSEFTALLYIPSMIPFDIYFDKFKVGTALYVRRVKIMDHCEELLPKYLRFVKGVVDSSDLPLNVSREMLQNNRQVDIINKNATKKVLDSLADMMQKEPEKYEEFFKIFGKVLKEGIHFDLSRREAIADLVLFKSIRTDKDKFTTLKDYVANIKEGQEEVYYITAPSVQEAMGSPYIEAFRDKGYDVLIMPDEFDDIIFNLFEYKGKKFKSVIKGDIKLDNKEEAEEKKVTAKKFKKLLDMIHDRLAEEVKEVRLSGRLKDSPCCLVTDEHAIDPAMERLLMSMGKEVPTSKRILELNPSHPLIQAMEKTFNDNATSEKLNEGIRLLYDQAVLLEGGKLKDPAAFTKTVAKLMAATMG
ncbi:molecular chaperone HtpG [Candidatus Magnetobacterium casense]|uniref:Chaperone protein HtpG n=1 Tax=Candidatus Magnetobacterium casense TaxID=1455061 RepID=A0ABS6RU55_9BACT|nr:molecular chaperone HtpG [Candidatus Magnetobacterium casensis]MBV6340156.1 molecular chaperone HtpG [Candidatus Magnetobacterium casensis]